MPCHGKATTLKNMAALLYQKKEYSSFQKFLSFYFEKYFQEVKASLISSHVVDLFFFKEKLKFFPN